VRSGPQQTHDTLAVDGVECAGRLVGEQQATPADDRPRNRDPLALAARELVRVAVRALGDGEPLERLDPTPAGGSRGDAVELERQSDVLEGRQPRERLKSWKT
jgi:hypothetical protein